MVLPFIDATFLCPQNFSLISSRIYNSRRKSEMTSSSSRAIRATGQWCHLLRMTLALSSTPHLLAVVSPTSTILLFALRPPLPYSSSHFGHLYHTPLRTSATSTILLFALRPPLPYSSSHFGHLYHTPLRTSATSTILLFALRPPLPYSSSHFGHLYHTPLRTSATSTILLFALRPPLLYFSSHFFQSYSYLFELQEIIILPSCVCLI